jgi:hypothetical protein
MSEPGNAAIAAMFDDIAERLEIQGALSHRVRAWYRGADAIRDLERPLGDIFAAEGVAGLEAIPHIGRRLARVIIEILRTGKTAVWERLRGEVGPHQLFASIPGLGDVLADRIHHDLRIDTLEQLETAAHDGRLEQVPGVGPRRARAVRDVLATRLSRAARRRGGTPGPSHRTRPPTVELLLSIDQHYRHQADRDTLPRIAPRRFNPGGEAWLPILHLEREGWTFTALYSNTALAHRLHKTRDWVVIFYEHDHTSGQCTVVTEWRGRLAGRRVVRGRERQCAAYYEISTADPARPTHTAAPVPKAATGSRPA